jgi:hypothetical protein
MDFDFFPPLLAASALSAAPAAEEVSVFFLSSEGRRSSFRFLTASTAFKPAGLEIIRSPDEDDTIIDL